MALVTDLGDPLKTGKKQDLLNTDVVKQYRNFDVPPGQSPTHQLPSTAHNLTPPGWNPATANVDTMRINPVTRPVTDITRPLDRNQIQFTAPQIIHPSIPRIITPIELMKTGHAVESIRSPPTTIGRYGAKRKLKKQNRKEKQSDKMFHGI